MKEKRSGNKKVEGKKEKSIELVRAMGLATKKKTPNYENISEAAKRMVSLANKFGAMVCENFNGIELVANPGDKAKKIIKFYNESSRTSYVLSDVQKEMKDLYKLLRLRKRNDGRIMINNFLKNRLMVLRDMINMVVDR